MLFNSLDFAIFFPIIYVLYWFVFNKSLKIQNILLMAASYFFYACWDWRFLFLLAFSTFLDYFTGLKIYNAKSDGRKKIWLWTSIIINLGFLGFFKYYNFFVESFIHTFQFFGADFKANYYTLSIVLPVGISFYTFHGLSYVLDIYYKRIVPCTNPVNYSLFVSFFPLLVAGPIERATHLLPQMEKPRSFNYGQSVDGLRQILWGFFKKMVIADNCADYANFAFTNEIGLNSSTLIIGAIFFAFQIYGDFSGYSDIALGTARLLGFDLIQNFAFPYFSRDMAEFWRRWHISLSSWFRDYLYIPLGGSKGGTWMRVRNTFIIFLVSGFWHGANWTFIVWGGLNALYFMPLLLTNNNRNNIEIVAKGRTFPTFRETINILLTFGLAVFAWIFFRAENLTKAFRYVGHIFDSSIMDLPMYPRRFTVFLIPLIFFIIIEWLGRDGKFAIQNIGKSNRVYRWILYSFIIFLLGVYMQTEETPFIYFNF